MFSDLADLVRRGSERKAPQHPATAGDLTPVAVPSPSPPFVVVPPLPTSVKEDNYDDTTRTGHGKRPRDHLPIDGSSAATAPPDVRSTEQVDPTGRHAQGMCAAVTVPDEPGAAHDTSTTPLAQKDIFAETAWLKRVVLELPPSLSPLLPASSEEFEKQRQSELLRIASDRNRVAVVYGRLVRCLVAYFSGNGSNMNTAALREMPTVVEQQQHHDAAGAHPPAPPRRAADFTNDDSSNGSEVVCSAVRCILPEIDENILLVAPPPATSTSARVIDDSPLMSNLAASVSEQEAWWFAAATLRMLELSRKYLTVSATASHRINRKETTSGATKLASGSSPLSVRVVGATVNFTDRASSERDDAATITIPNDSVAAVGEMGEETMDLPGGKMNDDSIGNSSVTVGFLKECYVRCWLQKLALDWQSQFASRTFSTASTLAAREAFRAHTAHMRHLAPLVDYLGTLALPSTLVDKLFQMFLLVSNGLFSASEQVYFSVAIGNQPWHIGIYTGGMHERREHGRMARGTVKHIMNNDVARRFLLATKALLSIAAATRS